MKKLICLIVGHSPEITHHGIYRYIRCTRCGRITYYVRRWQ